MVARKIQRKSRSKTKSKSAKRAARPAARQTQAAKFPAVAFIGVGNMAEEMVNAAVNSGWPRHRLFLTHRRPERRAELRPGRGSPGVHGRKGGRDR